MSVGDKALCYATKVSICSRRFIWWMVRKTGLSTQKIDKCNKKINNMFNFCKVAFNFCNTGRCVNFLEPYNFPFFSFFFFFFPAIEKTKFHKIGAYQTFAALHSWEISPENKTSKFKTSQFFIYFVSTDEWPPELSRWYDNQFNETQR